ncbi:YCF48-related protein [Pelomonas sp. KK5]|uniref:WD40/YVTN/BNR-like repeat-containing protein n=1 Tax=Pelomonas sp. KK5 TaxID=1855730 RepID=UPI00097C0F12|nr:YCF48-related protein [Pelomonas sp. KK5]
MKYWLICAALLGAAASAQEVLKPQPAAASPIAARAAILGTAKAGDKRLVGVGEHGIVLLSDDGGRTLRQAARVPLSSTLTSVSFADAKHGWAVGHWGAILATEDGGESWKIQRIAAQEDRPLFSVHFIDAQHGVAVGLWSQLLVTSDGGATWAEQKLPAPPGATKADANLLQLFAAPDGSALYIAAERGLVLRSRDHGMSWDYLPTGYKGSFWTGTALDDGSLLVAGQRGVVYRSGDGGARWERVELGGSTASITALSAQGRDVLAVGLDGLVAASHDGGRSFTARAREDRLALTALAAQRDGRWVLWSRTGLAETSYKP